MPLLGTCCIFICMHHSAAHVVLITTNRAKACNCSELFSLPMKDFAKGVCLPPLGMLLASMQANPDMMRQAVDMMSNMDPKQMSSMMASMQSGAGSPDPSAMAGLLRDPKSREMMRQMMSNVDAQQLASMSKAAGQDLTPEQVRRAP